ncbi:MAG: hypothetical protein ACLFPM_00770 [Candidatus Izemoplasmatales bacterium]
MKDYIDLQMDFLLSKINVTIIFFLLIVIMLSSLYNAQVMEGYAYLDGFRKDFQNDFLNESFMMIEFILVFISIYIGMVLGGHKNQALMIYSVYSKKTKYKYLMARLVTGIWMIAILLICVLLTIILIVYYFTPYVIDHIIYIKVSSLLFLQLIQYFVLTLTLLTIINHFLFGLLPLLIFWAVEITSYNMPKDLKNITEKIMVDINGYYYQEKSILIFLILLHFLIISYIIVMQKKDC